MAAGHPIEGRVVMIDPLELIGEAVSILFIADAAPETACRSHQSTLARRAFLSKCVLASSQ